MEVYGGNMEVYGGNRIEDLSRAHISYKDFANSTYTYTFFKLDMGQTKRIDDLESFTLYQLHRSKNPCEVLCRDLEAQNGPFTLRANDLIQVERKSLELQSVHGCASFLLAGVKNASFKKNPSIRYFSHDQVKKVHKPWGYELWFNGEHPGYIFKKMFIKAGHRTSLQYHEHKKETNVLFQGSARFHYKSNAQVENENVQGDDISTVDLTSLATIDVPVRVLHRMEAITDIHLYEVSTAHADDVIRIQDDTHRRHGRVELEHMTFV